LSGSEVAKLIAENARISACNACCKLCALCLYLIHSARGRTLHLRLPLSFLE
jgi:hypothetical protein